MDTKDEKQLEFDFCKVVCKCNETTKYEDLCPVCLDECLEYMNASSVDEDNYYLNEREHG